MEKFRPHFLILKNNSAGARRQKETTEKIVLRNRRSSTFSHILGQEETSAPTDLPQALALDHRLTREFLSTSIPVLRVQAFGEHAAF
jgi:hypothetical protein